MRLSTLAIYTTRAATKGRRRQRRRLELLTQGVEERIGRMERIGARATADLRALVGDKESKKKKYKDDSSDESKKKKKSSKSSSSKSSSHKKTSFRKARALIGKEMDSEAESEECDDEEASGEDSESGQASLALATNFVSKSIFNLEENECTIHTDDYADDFAPTYCFMARDKSDDLLNDEMNLNQILADDMKNLQSRFDILQDRYDTFLTDHEKLSYEFLQRKLDLEKLRMSYDDLRMENDSLLAQQISVSQVEFIPPCLKCIDRETANSSPESSNATTTTNTSTAPVVSISSLEENTSVTDENAGLKELYMTGMYKSLKGHQILCDVLKKQILNSNPRKEGIAFERKLNADGFYWKPEQMVSRKKEQDSVEMARTMLEEYRTPKASAEAINTACHIINRVYLHKFLKKTSYELFTDKKPNVSYFKVFGAKCWIRDPHHSSKFAPKAHEGFMLGYGKNSHTYRVFNNYHNKVVETVDVRFDETNGSQREQLPSDLDKLSPEEAIKLKLTEDIVPTEEIGEETLPIADERQEDAPEEIAIAPLPQPRQNPQPAHPRIANEVELDKILNDINAPEPSKVAEAFLEPEWIQAMQDELLQFKMNDVWELIKRPDPRKHNIIGTKWIFRNKQDEDDQVVRNKARLVAQGYTQCIPQW
ncbi:hypothetical protein ZWY2020_011127 [Hordeum vulgare]|nr:hypothetical protein ZWY2020_011127 [Hordeum vulgare]